MLSCKYFLTTAALLQYPCRGTLSPFHRATRRLTTTKLDSSLLTKGRSWQLRDIPVIHYVLPLTVTRLACRLERQVGILLSPLPTLSRYWGNHDRFDGSPFSASELQNFTYVAYEDDMNSVFL